LLSFYIHRGLVSTVYQKIKLYSACSGKLSRKNILMLIGKFLKSYLKFINLINLIFSFYLQFKRATLAIIITICILHKLKRNLV